VLASPRHLFMSSYDILVQIFLSACAKDQQTWEDTKKKGKGMTAVSIFLRPHSNKVFT
jgi:hypothetical protein